MKLLFVPMVGGRGLGPVFRCLAIAEEASKYFDIAFLCKKEFKQFVVEKYKYYEDVTPTPKGNQGDILLWDDAAYAMGLCEYEFVLRAFRHQLNVVSEYKADIIFTEYNLTILIVAKMLHIPIVSTINWADTEEFTLNGKINKIQHTDAILPYNEILKNYKCSCYRSISELIVSIPYMVAPTLPEFQPELKDYHPLYTGFLLCKTIELGSNAIDIDNNNIYVYLTSSDMENEVWFSIIIRELSKLSQTVYVVTNQTIDDIINSKRLIIPPNFKFARFWPSLKVLQKSKIVIHAGSANIIAGALISGVPSVMLPMQDGERLYNARAVERNSGGIIITEQVFFTPNGLYDSVQKIIHNDMYYKSSVQLGKKILSFGGAKKVVEFMQGLVYSSSED